MRITHRPSLGSPFRNPHSAFRNGLSLAEVMIALLVLAIGLMGVLALYPLGAKQMAEAVKDERASQLADIGEAYTRLYWRGAYLKSDGTLRSDAEVFAAAPELQKLDSPGALAGTNYLVTASEPSSPLYIDAIGFNAGGGQWVGGIQVIPRQSIDTIQALGRPPFNSQSKVTAASIRFFCLLDDMSFGDNGKPTNPVNRGYRYSYAALLQRAKNNVRQEVNLKVVVYMNRPPSDTPPLETLVTITNVSSTAVGGDQLSFAQPSGVPLSTFRSGAWVMLANQRTNLPQEAFADFYRVVGAQQSGGNYSLTVSPPIRNHLPAGQNQYSAYVFVLDGVVEVFDRGTITPFEVPAS